MDKVQLIAVRKGGVKCSSACPYYEERGCVRGMLGVPLKTHCRATMETVIIDCDVWNPLNIQKLEVTEDEWKTMQQSVGKKAKKERKAYPEDHAEIHPVGCEWTRSKDKWNANKSSNIKH